MKVDKAVEKALLKVAGNVAKHLLQGKPWSEEDACFKIDLREAETELNALIAGSIAEEREACAKVAAGWSGRRLEGSDPEQETHKAFGRGVDMAAYYIAQSIRERK